MSLKQVNLNKSQNTSKKISWNYWNAEKLCYKQQESFFMLTKKFTNHLNLNPGQSKNFIPKLCPDKPVSQVSEFHHDPEVDLTFLSWFDKCKCVFRKDLIEIAEENRVRPRNTKN